MIEHLIESKQIGDCKWLGIIQAEHHYPESFFKSQVYIQKKDYLVIGWFDFHDGEKSHIEGRAMISLHKELKDAMNSYQYNINDLDEISVKILNEVVLLKHEMDENWKKITGKNFWNNENMSMNAFNG